MMIIMRLKTVLYMSSVALEGTGDAEDASS